MARRGRPKHPDILTPREWEVLELLRDGRSNESVAEALGISLATARFHVSEIIGKLGVTNRHEAATWQPQPTADRPPRAWILAPIAAAREIRWSTVGVALGATATAAALALLALLIWGVSRTFSVSSSDAAAICTPGPTPPSSTLASEQRKTPLPPDLRPDSTRQAEIDQALQRNRDWSSRFIAAGCDPHALPDFANEQYQGLGYGNPDQVVADADVIVRAHVDATSFSIDDSRDTPLAHASVTVVENLKGTTANTLILNEVGGQYRNPTGGPCSTSTGSRCSSQAMR